MKILEDMNLCYGCGACANICPVNAVHMEMNEEGFPVPAVDGEKCIGCGLCRKVCIAGVSGEAQRNTGEASAYAFSAEELLTESSSGGVFSVLAQRVLGMEGVVFGAAFGEEFQCVHVPVAKAEELHRLRLSKYVQSRIGDSYRQVKELLEEGRWVLFSGTSCQVDGLFHFLGREYEKLLTVDLVCHGVPAPGIFREYLESHYGIENIEKIEMRKREGWSSCFHVELKDGRKYEQESRKNIYQVAFLRNLTLRRTCYHCRYQSLPRTADITIGDLWGAKRLKLGQPFEKKSSVVLVNNERAKEFFAMALLDSEYHISKVNLSAKGIPLTRLNKNIYACITNKTRQREEFYEKRKTMPFDKAVLRTLYPDCVGLLVYMQDNYGSCATNVGLYKAVEQLGYTPVILSHLTAIRGVSKNYAQGRLNLSENFLERNDYRAANLLCDSFVLGSDQSMRWDFKRVMGNLQWLFMAFAGADKRKIVYSGSLGPERSEVDIHVQRVYTKLLSRFTDFSVREDYAVDMCGNLFGVRPRQCIDPVFLVKKEVYLKMIEESSVSPAKPYLLAYLRYYSEEKLELIRRQAEREKLSIVIICDANSYEELSGKYQAEEVISKPEFVDWLSYYAHAACIITDSFHGTCFSLIFEKRFVSIKAGTTRRFDSLARTLGADCGEKVQIFDSEKELLGREEIFGELDYEKLGEVIEEERQKGLSWLKNALERPMAAESTEGGGMTPEDLMAYCGLLKDYFEWKETAEKK